MWFYLNPVAMWRGTVPAVAAAGTAPTRYRMWAVVVLVIELAVAGVILYGAWRYGVKSVYNKLAGNPTSASSTTAFQSNLESLDDPSMEAAAQMALVEENLERVVEKLVEKGFTSHDKAVAVKAGRQIYAIGGERAIPIMLKYTRDNRVVVSEWAKLWYAHYNPGKTLQRIETCEKAIKDVKEVKAKVDEQAVQLNKEIEHIANMKAVIAKAIAAAQVKQSARISHEAAAIKAAVLENSRAQKVLEAEIRAVRAQSSSVSAEVKELLLKAESLRQPPPFSSSGARTVPPTNSRGYRSCW